MRTFEKALKPYVNWKLYNYILNKFVKYEDKDDSMILYLFYSTDGSINNLKGFYGYTTKNGGNWTSYPHNNSADLDRVSDVVAEAYLKAFGTFYVIKTDDEFSGELIDDLRSYNKLELVDSIDNKHYFKEKK